MMGILVVLGTFMEWIAIVFITVPVFAPVVRDLARSWAWTRSGPPSGSACCS